MAGRCWVLMMALVGVVSGCVSVDHEQARLCERVVLAIEFLHDRHSQSTGPPPHILGYERESDRRMVVRYRRGRGLPDTHWIACGFAGSGFAPGRRDLIAVETDRTGHLSTAAMFTLKRYWLETPTSRAWASGALSGGIGSAVGLPLPREVAYFVQQLVNGVPIGLLYGLLAMAYTLVFSITRRINLAFGEFAMVAAFFTFAGVQILSQGIGVNVGVAVALPLILAVVVLFSAGFGWAVEWVVFRPLAGRRSQAVLVATIGLAIFLQEYLRLAVGGNDWLIQSVLSQTLVIASAAGFPVALTPFHLLVVVMAITLFAFQLSWLDHRPFGKMRRACNQDPGMAALCGVDVSRVVSRTFMLAAGYAAVAGWILMLRYGIGNFHMGTALGIKALTAAIVGGIGSVRGAILGGMLIGLLETFWAGYLPGAYRDVAVFGLLAVTLMLRPNGVLGGGARDNERRV